MSDMVHMILHEIECTNSMLRDVVDVNRQAIIRSTHVEHIIASTHVVNRGGVAFIINEDGKSVPVAALNTIVRIQAQFSKLTGYMPDLGVVLDILDGLNLKSFDYVDKTPGGE